eukprot:4931845-Heterocapsa_arctica.AAC.1
MHGWQDQEVPDAAYRNLEAEYLIYLEAQDALWKFTSGNAWDGINNPCMCRKFVHAHYHRTARHQEGARAPADTAIPFWERVLELEQ